LDHTDLERRPPPVHLRHGKFPQAPVATPVGDAPFPDRLGVTLRDRRTRQAVLARRGEQFRIPQDALRQTFQGRQRNQQSHVAEGRRVVFPRTDGLEDGRTDGMGMTPLCPSRQYASPFSTARTRVSSCSTRHRASRHRALGGRPCGWPAVRSGRRNPPRTAPPAGPRTRRRRTRRQRLVAGRYSRPAASRSKRRNALNPGPHPARGIEQEGPFPNRCAPRIVRLSIDRNNRPLVRSFEEARHNDQGVAIWVREHGARSQRLHGSVRPGKSRWRRRRDRCGRCPNHRVLDPPRQLVELAQRHRSRTKALINDGVPHRAGRSRSPIAAANATGSPTSRRNRRGESRASRTIRCRRGVHRLTPAKVVEQKVAGGIAEHRLEGRPAQVSSAGHRTAVRSMPRRTPPRGVPCIEHRPSDGTPTGASPNCHVPAGKRLVAAAHFDRYSRRVRPRGCRTHSRGAPLSVCVQRPAPHPRSDGDETLRGPSDSNAMTGAEYPRG